MHYTSLERIRRNGRHQITFTGIEKDRTGLGGTWESGGIFAEIHEVGEYLILQNVFLQKPFAVFRSVEEIDNYLKSLISDGTKNKAATKADRADTKAAPVRLIAFSSGDF